MDRVNMITFLMPFFLLYMLREKNSVLASQRRAERKLKELNLMLDEERQTHTEQRDQVYTFSIYCTCACDFCEKSDNIKAHTVQYTIKVHVVL